jgi:hypothetical protein
MTGMEDAPAMVSLRRVRSETTYCVERGKLLYLLLAALELGV